MKLVKKFQRSMFFAVICALFFLPLLVVHGQDSQTITAQGTITGNGISIPFTIEFPPNGGPVTGTIIYSGAATNEGARCPDTLIVAITGNFAGGDGGAANGGFEGTEQVTCADRSIGDLTITYHPGGVINGEIIGSGWIGNFYANGTGSGTMVFRASAWDLEENVTWQVTFSDAEFQAALPNNITSEYIFTTYGIHVEDSLGGDQWVQKSWSAHEIGLLNDVLKTLPPGFLNQISLTRIVRNAVKIDNNGTAKPNVMGTYYSCDEKTDPDCTGASSTIRIFDSATEARLFPDDPDKEFKATILHEIIHAYQWHKDKNSTYTKVFESPLVKDYIEATRPRQGLDTPPNGWNYSEPPPDWVLWTDESHSPPTEYGKISPIEDMSESVKMYVYDPKKLLDSSEARYYFIRDKMFGGIEYDNGKQKKP